MVEAALLTSHSAICRSTHSLGSRSGTLPLSEILNVTGGFLLHTAHYGALQSPTSCRKHVAWKAALYGFRLPEIVSSMEKGGGPRQGESDSTVLAFIGHLGKMTRNSKPWELFPVI